MIGEGRDCTRALHINARAMGRHDTVEDVRELPLYRDAEPNRREERADQAHTCRSITRVATAAPAAGYDW